MQLILEFQKNNFIPLGWFLNFIYNSLGYFLFLPVVRSICGTQCMKKVLLYELKFKVQFIAFTY